MAGAGETSWSGPAPASSAPSAASLGGRGAARLLRWPPPAVALGLALAAAATHGLLHGLAAPYGQAPLAGAALVIAGLWWTVWAWACLRAAGTPGRPAGPPRVLVDHGPFAFGRNPVSLGIAAALTGLALALGMPLLVLAAAAFMAIVARVHVPHEEAALKRAFGGWYSDYAAQVRRWI